MNSNYFMTVGAVIYIKEKGYVITGTIDSDIDKLYIGEKNDYIIVKSEGFNYEFKIKDINVSTSISGNFNIGILILESENISNINIGDKVYSVCK